MDELTQNIQEFIIQSKLKEAFNVLKGRFHDYLSILQKRTLKLIEANFNEILNREIDGTISTEEASIAKTNINKRILELLDLVVNDSEKAQSRFNILHENLIRSFKYSFLGRIDFRKEIIAQADEKNSKILFIEGTPKSGMSYLEQFLRHFSEINNDMDIRIVPINMGNMLNIPGENKSAKILEILFASIGSDLPLGDDTIKFIRLENALREQVNNKVMFLFFFHDFHKAIFIPEDIYRLIYELITRSSNSLFIFSGLDYKAIPNCNDVKNLFEFYRIPVNEPTPDIIEECFHKIFDKYKENIFNSLEGRQITKEDYYSNISKKIFSDHQKLDICTVGDIINDHLFHLKRY
ncbi:hypothetical protein [Chryseobacterium sp. 52]|uniref:hypothetical protein n=1 Tax=Chryseobacterium sp. 52 TaxID=2035213 RepID=UPI00117D7969|nr:hypothetical protein [Chryseobacterium sp. 52]